MRSFCFFTEVEVFCKFPAWSFGSKLGGGHPSVQCKGVISMCQARLNRNLMSSPEIQYRVWICQVHVCKRISWSERENISATLNRRCTLLEHSWNIITETLQSRLLLCNLYCFSLVCRFAPSSRSSWLSTWPVNIINHTWNVLYWKLF